MASKPFKNDWVTVKLREKIMFHGYAHVEIQIPKMNIGIKFYGDDFHDNTYIYFFSIMNLDTNENCDCALESSFPKQELSVWYILQYLKFYAENNGLNRDVASDRRLSHRLSKDSLFAYLCYRNRMASFVDRNHFIDRIKWYENALMEHSIMFRSPLSRTFFTSNQTIKLEGW